MAAHLPRSHVTPDLHSPARGNAEVLLWQGRVRILVAFVAGGAAFVLQQLGILRGSGPALLGLVAGYMAIVGLLGLRIHRTGTAGDPMIVATVLADLVFIFASTIASSPAAQYDRILILAFFVLHLTESYFGRQHAIFALLATIAGYLLTTKVMIARGMAMDWPDALWSVGLFTICAVVFINQYGSFQRRLAHIVDLFESAEEGDFAKAYDVKADTNPDAITRVGRAYNRVRLQLASMVLTDPLTGCLNRRGLDQALAREIARASRAGSNLALLALDLDHFKEINDTYGHIAGDVVLRQVGALLTQTARAGDNVARTGGEGFTVLLPDTDADGAYHSGVRICETVRTHAFMVNGKRLHLTVSVGIVSSTAIGGDAVGTNLKGRADEALYTAKRAGRDRVSVWDESLPLTLTPIHTMVVPAKSRL